MYIMASVLLLITLYASDIVKYIHRYDNLASLSSLMSALSFKTTKHSLHISMLLRTRLVLRRNQATMRPIEMACKTSSMLFMSYTSVRIKRECECENKFDVFNCCWF